MSSTISQTSTPSNPLQKQGTPTITEARRFRMIRSEVTDYILKIVQQITAGSPTISPAKSRALAERLEKILFRTATSLEAYADKETIKKRISLLSRSVLKAKQTERAHIDSSVSSNDKTSKTLVTRKHYLLQSKAIMSKIKMSNNGAAA